MEPTLVLTFRQDVSLTHVGKDHMGIRTPSGEITLNGLAPSLLNALQMLFSGGVTANELSKLVLESDGPSALSILYFQLRRCEILGLICYTLVLDRPVAKCIYMAPGFTFCPKTINVRKRFFLSRFAYCRRDGNSVVIESPLSSARIVVLEPALVGIFSELALPRTYAYLCSKNRHLTRGVVRAFLELLANASFIFELQGNDLLPEDDDPILVQWEFHDLLFHSRSRAGLHDYPLGGTFPFLGRIPPLPALKPPASGKTVPLFRPDIQHLVNEDLSFTQVLEARCSIRSYAEHPITARQLGEFLYRVARVRNLIGADPKRGVHYEFSNRPYPSGGASYDLEIYLTVNECEEVPPGIYHYDPLNHQLSRIADRNSFAEALLLDAKRSAALSFLPQILITLASRFQRLSWKYRGIAYATTLKNVGVLYQTMYLVATAMSLAPCALGGGNSTLFAKATNTNYFAESSVGEFLLGAVRPQAETTEG